MTCLVCGSPLSNKFKSLSAKHRYVYCTMCCNWNLAPRPKSVKDIYDRQYFNNPLPESSATKLMYQLKFYPHAWDWVNSVQTKPGKILDVGCGDGGFLYHMNLFNWEVFGSDLSKDAIKLTRSRINNATLYTGDLHALKKKFSKNKFDAITMWHVLEHLIKPKDNIATCYRLLKKGGQVYIEVPSADSWVFQLFPKHYNWLKVPEHVTYWSCLGIVKLLKEQGFKNIKLHTPPKANLNFSLSFYRYMVDKLPRVLSSSIFYFSIPFSVGLSIVFSYMGKGEAIRVSAQK